MFLLGCAVVLSFGFSHAGLHPQGKFDFLKGQAAYQKGDYQTAIKHLNNYLKKDPAGYHRVHNTLGQSYHKLKNYKEAEKYYKQAVSQAPQEYSALYRFNLGVLYYDMTEYDKCISHLNYAAENLPRFPMEASERKALAWYYLGHANLKRKAWEQASHDFEQSAHLTTKLNQGAWFYKGIAEYNSGRVKIAEDNFKLAERIGTSQALNKYAAQFAAQSQKAQETSHWSILVGGGYTYDDNLILEPDDRTFSWVSNLTEERGGYGRLLAVPSYFTFFKNDWSFQGKGLVAKTVNQNRAKHQELDALQGGVNFVFSKDFKARNALLSFDGGIAYLTRAVRSNKWMSTDYTLDTTYQKTWNSTRTWATQGGLRLAYLDYKIDARDGGDAALSIAQNYSSLGKRLFASLRLGVGQNFSTALLYEQRRYMANVGFRYNLWKSLNIEPMYDIRFDKNRDGRVSDQTTHTAQLALSYSWTDKISSSLAYSYIQGVANKDTPNYQALEYHRNLVTLMLFAKAI